MEDFLPNQLMFRDDSMELSVTVSSHRRSILAKYQSIAPMSYDDVAACQVAAMY